MKYKIKYGKKFSKDIEKAKKQNKDMNKLKKVLNLLVGSLPLPAQYKNHNLKGKYSGYQECHIQPDWLLIYTYNDDYLILFRLGSHSELFN